MAKNYSDIYTSVYDKGNSMSFGNAMLRGNGIPLDITEVYNSYNAAVLYAAENPVAYEGQILAVTENGDTTVYVITPALQDTISIDTGDGITKDVSVYIKEVGSVPAADGKTVEVVDGVLRLVGLDELDNSKTYQPVLVNGTIEWHEPSATTVEGLDTRLTAVEGRATDLETDVDTIEGDVATAKEDIEAAKLAIGVLQDEAEDYKTADTDLHTTITGEIATALEAAKKYADDNDADTIYDDTTVRADIAANAAKIAAVEETAAKNAANLSAEVEARETADAELETTLKSYVAEEIGKQAHFSAKVVDSTAEMNDATTLYLMKTAETGDDMYEEWMLIEGTPAKIGTTATDLTDYAKTADVESKIDTVKTDLQAALDAEVEARQSADADLTTAIEGVAADLAEFETSVADTYETKEAAAATKTALEGDIAALEADVALKAVKTEVDSAVAAVNDKATAAQEAATANAGEIAKLKNADEGIIARVGALEGVDAEKNIINSTSSEFTVDENRQLSVSAIDKTKVTGLTADLQALQDNKVDKVFSNIDGEQVAWKLLSPENEAKLEALVLGDTGNVEISGTVNAHNVQGLDTYITDNRDKVAGLLSNDQETKLAGIAAGAQVNVIEKIKINGAELAIEDKAINIPFATNNTIGVVLSSEDENKVAVLADGTMEVNSLNVNKLVQTDGDTLILNGGHA